MQSKLDDSDPAETTVSPTPAIDHVGGLEAAVVPQRRRSWPRPTPVAVVLVGLVALGAWLRLHAFGFPSTLQFDEHHFVENARNYLQHHADTNDHPPLGKLIIAAAIQVWGDNAA